MATHSKRLFTGAHGIDGKQTNTPAAKRWLIISKTRLNSAHRVTLIDPECAASVGHRVVAGVGVVGSATRVQVKEANSGTVRREGVSGLDVNKLTEDAIVCRISCTPMMTYARCLGSRSAAAAEPLYPRSFITS